MKQRTTKARSPEAFPQGSTQRKRKRRELENLMYLAKLTCQTTSNAVWKSKIEETQLIVSLNTDAINFYSQLPMTIIGAQYAG